jgi:endonuclease/exonuclease/phosphatase family metal-dependent hydrolase
MIARKTFRQIAEWMDDRSLEKTFGSPEYELSSPVYELRFLAKQHRWINFDESYISFRDIIERHKGGTDRKYVSFLFYNSYLLDGVAGIGGKPFRSLRADLIGKEIRNSKYDIAALCEVFEEKYQKIIKKQRFPYDAMGPVWTVGNTSSGLYTLSRFSLTYKRRRFEEKGYPPDSFSNKGILLTTIDLGIGKVDLYSTHLFWGETVVEDIASYYSKGISKIAQIFQIEIKPVNLRTLIQLAQLKELTEFIKETHNPKHVVIVAGDMNINPGKSRVNGEAYEKMRNLLSNITLKNGVKISLEDLWKIKGGKRGGTNMPTQGCAIETRLTNPTSGILYCNDDSNEPTEAKNEEGRYDYIFVQKPVSSHDIIIDFSRMKRRPFPIPELKFEEIKDLLSHPIFIQDPAFLPLIRNMNPTQITEFVSEKINQVCQGHLSDHIGVDVKLVVNKK